MPRCATRPTCPRTCPRAVRRLLARRHEPVPPHPVRRSRRSRGASRRALVHLHYFASPRLPCPAVVTVHDISYARAPELFSRRDRIALALRARVGAPRSARDRRLGVHARRHDRSSTGSIPAKVVAVPNGVGDRASGRIADAGRARARALRHQPAVHALRRRAAGAQERAARDRGLRADHGPRNRLRARDRGRRQGRAPRRARRDPAHAPDRPRPSRRARGATTALPALYSAARALVFPSLYEGFGLPALEAMASRHARDREQHDRARRGGRRRRA